MRATASTYAPRQTRAIEEERDYRQRLAEARRERQARAAAASVAHAELIRAYHAEKAKRIEQGKPVLTPIEEWRCGR